MVTLKCIAFPRVTRPFLLYGIATSPKRSDCQVPHPLLNPSQKHILISEYLQGLWYDCILSAGKLFKTIFIQSHSLYSYLI